MQISFPGMNPYLEAPDLWRSFHHLLADEVMALLNGQLSPRYYADVEVRTWLEEVSIASPSIVYPDVAVLETQPSPLAPTTAALAPAPILRAAVAPDPFKLRAVHVYTSSTHTLVTAIKILSPTNKRGGGMQEYREKRRRLLQSDVHLIEIDLLRGGERPGWEVHEPPIDTDYVLLVNRASDGAGRSSEIWPVALNEPLPTLPVPLLFPDPDLPLPLGAVFASVWQRARYGQRIDTTQPLPPPEPRPAIATWLAAQTT